MAKILDREATIKTVAVEIKALTVSGKQVTLALYRQIPQAVLIDVDSMTLNGEPWGRVNYHYPECKDYHEHLHVVWQKDETLYQSRVSPDGWNGRHYRLDGESFPPFYAALTLAARDNVGTVSYVSSDPVTVDGLTCGRMPSELKNHFRNYWRVLAEDRGSEDEYQRQLAQQPLAGSTNYEYWLDRWKQDVRTANVRRTQTLAPEAWAYFISKLCGWLPKDWQRHSQDYWLEEFHKIRRQVAQVEPDFTRLYESLEALDQLYIAV